MTASEQYWLERSDNEILDALNVIADYTHDAQDQIYLEAKKRGLLAGQRLAFVLEQIHGRIEGSQPAVHATTVDVSKASRLRGRSVFAPRILVFLGLLQILGSGAGFADYDDAVLDAMLGVVNLVLAVAMFKRRRAVPHIARGLLAILAPIWGLMVVDDIARDGVLNHARPLAFASLALLGLVCCTATLRLDAVGRALSPVLVESRMPFQAKYFHNWKTLKAVAALMGACLVFTIGVSSALSTIWIEQRLAGVGLAAVPWEMALLRVGGFALALLGAPFFWSLARRFASLSALKLRQRDQRPSILYLRSFGDDQIRFSSGFERVVAALFPLLRFLIRDVTFEESVVTAASAFGPVVTLSEPGRNLPPIGAAREGTLEGTWTDTVDALIRDSVAVVAVIGNTPGLLWELRHLRERASLHKLLLVVPPVGRKELLERLQALFDALHETKHVPYDSVLDGGLILLWQHGAHPVVIVSRSREERDYAEAIREAASYVQTGADIA